MTTRPDTRRPRRPVPYRIRKHEAGRALYLARISLVTFLTGRLQWTADRAQALSLKRQAAGVAIAQAAMVLRAHCQLDAVPARGGWPQFTTTL
jgi:hypothetical protein